MAYPYGEEVADSAARTRGVKSGFFRRNPWEGVGLGKNSIEAGDMYNISYINISWAKRLRSYYEASHDRRGRRHSLRRVMLIDSNPIFSYGVDAEKNSAEAENEHDIYYINMFKPNGPRKTMPVSTTIERDDILISFCESCRFYHTLHLQTGNLLQSKQQ